MIPFSPYLLLYPSWWIHIALRNSPLSWRFYQRLITNCSRYKCRICLYIYDSEPIEFIEFPIFLPSIMCFGNSGSNWLPMGECGCSQLLRSLLTHWIVIPSPKKMKHPNCMVPIMWKFPYWTMVSKGVFNIRKRLFTFLFPLSSYLPSNVASLNPLVND